MDGGTTREHDRPSVDEPGRRRRRRVAGVGIASLVVLLALVVAASYTWQVWSTIADLPRDASLMPERAPATGVATAPAAGSAEVTAGSAPSVDTLNYLLLGTDAATDGDPGRSDVMMLAHVAPNRDRVYLISFPRDLWVHIPGRSLSKINAAYAHGGGALAVEAVEGLTGVRVDHVAVVDFDGFVALTNTLGGVTVNNRIASSVGPYRFPAGEITVSGDEALAYVRERKDIPGGDLVRAERQRAVMGAIIQRMTSPQVLLNPATFTSMLSELGRNVRVDSDLTNDAIISTVTSLNLPSTDGVRSLQVPVTGPGTSDDGQSILLPDETQLSALAEALRTGTMDQYYEAYGP